MPDLDSGSATAKTSTFYTDADGYLKTPEKLPLGRYRVVEIEGPEGFFNDEQYNVVFELTSERVWEVVGNAADDMDDFIITEEYRNHETLGQLTIRKVGNVLTVTRTASSSTSKPTWPEPPTRSAPARHCHRRPPGHAVVCRRRPGRHRDHRRRRPGG